MTVKTFGHFENRTDAGGGCWIDLKSPDQREIDEVCHTTGLRIPSRAELEEIETSSRTYVSANALYVSLPMLAKTAPGVSMATPVGFILTPDTLVTVHFDELPALQHVQDSLAEMASTSEVFVRIIEAIVDQLADIEESVEGTFIKMSNEIFAQQSQHGKPSHANADMRALLRQVGHFGSLISLVRGCLLGLIRIIPFVQDQSSDWLKKQCAERLAVAKEDVASLIEFETHLSDKMQFLLDATLGFVNIAQNELFRILTIVSVIGIPPTVLVGVWGMNFKHMPELDWSFGYPLSIAAILLSAAIPTIWFKIRGWL
jgi:magnesium transporter